MKIDTNIRDYIKGEKEIFELNDTSKEKFDEETKSYKPHHKANYFQELIVAAYNNNNGKLPDFTDGKWKGSPYFRMGSPAGVGFAFDGCAHWPAYSFVGARLVFYGDEYEENIRDAVKKFPDAFKESMTT